MARYTETYTAAATDDVLVSVPSGQIFQCTGWTCSTDAACTVNVSVSLEFDDTVDVYFAGHPGIRPGGTFGEKGEVADGADGQDVIVTISVPTGGSAVVTVNGQFQDAV